MPGDETTNGSVLARAVAGDEEALVDLLRRYGVALRVALGQEIPSRVRSVLSPEDVLQQTYTDAFLDIGGFDPDDGEAAFRGWLKQLARNNLRDVLRQLDAEKRGGAGARQVGSNRDESFEGLFERLLFDSGGSPSRQAAAREMAAAMRAAVDRLPEDYGRVVTLYDLEGRPIEEVAAELDRSTGAVYLLRNRAHRRLRELLGAETRFFSKSP